MWDNVELLTSDDTGSGQLSIGSRQECGSALYQMNTLVKITSSQKVFSNPELKAYSLSDGCLLAVDRTVVVLDNVCQSLQMFIPFETEVDIVALCQEGQFLVVGERNGNLHLIQVSSKQILLTKALVQSSFDEKAFLDLILERDSSVQGTYHAFILTSKGFFCILHLPLANIQKAITEMDISAASKLQSQVETCFISVEDYLTAGCFTCVTKDSTNSFAVIIGVTQTLFECWVKGSGSCAVSVWEVNPDKKLASIQDVAESSLIEAAKNLQVVENLLFVLDKKAVLSLWDLPTLTMTWHCPSVHMEEFLLTSESDFSAGGGLGIANLKLVALTTPDHVEQMKSIVVFSLPAMRQLYALEVSPVSTLVWSVINTDTIYFMEGMYGKNQKSSSDPVSFLLMRSLTEALPENRLSRLLHKHKFPEAESFALQFGLEIELVYKVKANTILEGLVSAGSEDQSAWLKLVLQAKETLNKIKDNSFVAEYCINAPWPTYETAQEMLNYARVAILKKEAPAATHFTYSDPASFLTEVLQTQEKLTTFYGAFGPEKYSGTTWLEFLKNKDVFSYILSQLKGGNLSSAQYLWLRNQAALERSFSQEMLEALLESISGTLPLQELAQWLKQVVLPFVRRVLPRGQKEVAKWLEGRARSLELTDKANWPENGLALAEVFFTSKDVGDVGLASFFHFSKDGEDREIQRLMDLVGALQDLVDLYRKYNCRLTLCNFEKETPNTIVFRMLDKIRAAELLPAALENYIEPYMRHHYIKKDEILLQYIKDLLLRHRTRSSSVFDTMWEAKAIAVLGCMSNLELIFEGVLAIMHSAVVPWSPGVEDLVQRYRGMEHARVKLLEEGYRLMEMKKLLRSYGIRDTNLLNDKQMILMLGKFILKQDRPSALEDALKIIKAYMLPTAEVYIWKITDLVNKEKGEDILDLLKSLTPSEAVEIAERTLIWGKIVLEEEVDTAEQKKMHLQVKKALVEILKLLLNLQKENHSKKEECEKDLETFRILVTLQESFEICISPKRFCDPWWTTRLLEDHIRAHEKARRLRNPQGVEETKPGDPSGKKALTQTRLYRLGFLLQKSEAEVGAQLALRALDDGEVKEALQICSYFYESHYNEETGRLLFLVSQKLCHMLESNIPMVLPEVQDLPEVIYCMACQAATLCSPDLILDVLEFCKHASFAREIYAKCQMEDLGFLPQASSLQTEKDPYGAWTFEDFFTEDGAVLDTPAVLPSTYKIASSLVPLAEWTASPPLESASLAYCSFKQGRNRLRLCKNAIFSLLGSLQESSQYELAFGLISNAFGSLFQHMTSNNMDVTLSKKLHDQKMLEEVRMFLLAVMQNSISLIQSIVTALLHKMFNSHCVDHQLAFGYCTLLPRAVIFRKLWDIVNQMSQNYKKVLAVAIVGTQLALHYEDPQEKAAFEDLLVDAEWGITLGKLGISFQSVFRMPSVRKKELLRTLVQHPNADTSLLLKFCRTFHLDTEAALQLYIETQLQDASWDQGDLQPGAGKERHVQAVARALETIPLLSSTTGLVTSLSAMLHKVDPYNYEVIESLLTVIERAGGQATGFPLTRANMLLTHLKSYKRMSPPGELEQQFLFEQGFCLSPPAHTRLPFHLMFFKTSQCFWKIIRAEINQESFPTLLLICKVMKVSLDNLHLSAVNHIFQEALKPKLLAATTAGGHLCPVDQRTEETMQAVQSYLMSITNPEWATALAHQIAQELPTGPSKVQTLKICLGLAKQWAKNPRVTEESREKAQAHLKKLQGQHKKAATEAVLAAQKLNTEDHQKLLAKPTSLTIQLYQHSSVAERIQNPTGRDYPDIHAAAREIAQINDLDLKRTWDHLLERWLCPNALPTGEASEGLENVQEEDDLKRVIYLLQAYPVENQLRILYECAVSATSPIGVNQLTFAHRSRALQCLLFLADPSAIESLFKKPMEKVRNFMKCFVYLAQLEALNIPYTYESFHRAPKEGMIKGLWKNHSHEPKAVKLVAELSLQYEVYDPLLWNGLLQKLMGFKMVHCLRKVLVEISGIYSLWPIPNYSRAWQCVILAPMLSALGPPNLDQLEAFCGSFKMLLMCPVLADLDLTGIAKRYAQLDLTALALGCLVLIPQQEKRVQQIQAFLSSSDLERLLQQTEEHLSLGEAAVVASQVRSSVLDHILHQTDKDLADVKYFPLLKIQERHPGQVKGLVEKMVAKDRMEDAASLIREYLLKPEMSPPLERTASEVVKMYFRELA